MLDSTWSIPPGTAVHFASLLAGLASLEVELEETVAQLMDQVPLRSPLEMQLQGSNQNPPIESIHLPAAPKEDLHLAARMVTHSQSAWVHSNSRILATLFPSASPS